jgi:hypothetical protein
MGCMLHKVLAPVRAPAQSELEHEAAKAAWWGNLTLAEQKLWKAGEEWQSGEKPLCTDQKAFTKQVQEFLVRDAETAKVCELAVAVLCCQYRMKLWTLPRLRRQGRSCTCSKFVVEAVHGPSSCCIKLAYGVRRCLHPVR